MPIFFSLKLFLISALLIGGCGQAPQARHYQEITVEAAAPDPHAGLDMSAMKLPAQQQTDDPQLQQMLQASVVKAPIVWQTPPDWKETPGSGMRLASFTSPEDDPITCTIVSLAGVAGGLEENIRRWMQQVGLEISGDEFIKFMDTVKETRTEGGLPLQIIDLASLQDDKDQGRDSMKAAIIDLDQLTVFIKMTGTQRAVEKNDASFRKFCASIRLNNE